MKITSEDRCTAAQLLRPRIPLAPDTPTLPERRNRRAPRAGILIAASKREHERRPPEQCMDRGAQRAGAFSVNDANLAQAFRCALLEINRNQLPEVTRAKRV